MNLGDARASVIKLIKEYSNSGTVITDGQNADYLLSMNTFLDKAQREVATTEKHIKKRHDVSNYPIEPLIGEWMTKQFLLVDYAVAADGAKSYYFEVNNTATIYIEEEVAGVWNILETINATPTDGYEAYKGNIADTDTNKRIRFSGSYPYSYRNYALFGYLFETVNKIPDYKPYIEYELPAILYELADVVKTADVAIYEHYGDYRLETRDDNLKYFLVHYNDAGEFQIHYHAFPTVIDSDTALTYEFEIEPDAQDAMLYYAGYLCKIEEDPYLASKMQNEYFSRMNNLVEESVNKGLVKVANLTGW